jgi:sterol 3beta-glucosyltransferase
VVPKPPDWGDEISLTGYWFLETSKNNWEPPQDLSDFLKKGERMGHVSEIS